MIQLIVRHAGIFTTASVLLIQARCGFAFAESSQGAALLIDESTRTVFLLPNTNTENRSLPSQVGSSGTANPPAIQALEYSFVAGVPFKDGVVLSEKINSTETPLADRVGIYTAAVFKKVGAFTWNRELAEKAKQFLIANGKVGPGIQQMKEPWPPILPLSASPLKDTDGTLFVFTCKNADKTGTLQKIDLIRFQGGRLIRTYWSRNFNDPTQAESAASALDKAAQHFAKAQKSPVVQLEKGKLRLIVNKKVGEKDLQKVESILSGLAAGNDFTLVPYEVNKEDIRYQTPLDQKAATQILQQLKTSTPNLFVRTVPGNLGFLQIMPKQAQE